MLIALSVMLGIWLLAFLMKKYLLKSCGTILSAFMALVLAVVAVIAQLGLIYVINDPVDGTYDPMVYMRGAFLTFCISAFIVYSTMKDEPEKDDDG